MSSNNELVALRRENSELRERLETAHRELADSVRAEIDLKYKIKELWEKIDHMKLQLTKQET